MRSPDVATCVNLSVVILGLWVIYENGFIVILRNS
jgi:hypothetical protein